MQSQGNERAQRLMAAQQQSGVQMPPRNAPQRPDMPPPQPAGPPPQRIGAESTNSKVSYPMPASPLRDRGGADQAAPEQASAVPGRDLQSNVQAAREHAGSGSEEATPEEQAEYERVITAVDAAIYGDDNVNRSVLNGIIPQDKISSIAQTSALLLKQLDDKLDMDEIVIPQVTMDIVDRVVDIAENGKGLQISDSELQAILGSTWEVIMAAYGADPDAYAELTQGMSDDDIAGFEKQYYEFLQGAGK